MVEKLVELHLKALIVGCLGMRSATVWQHFYLVPQLPENWHFVWKNLIASSHLSASVYKWQCIVGGEGVQAQIDEIRLHCVCAKNDVISVKFR